MYSQCILVQGVDKHNHSLHGRQDSGKILRAVASKFFFELIILKQSSTAVSEIHILAFTVTIRRAVTIRLAFTSWLAFSIHLAWLIRLGLFAFSFL